MKGARSERIAELHSMYPVWEECTIWERFEKCRTRFGGQVFVCFGARRATYDQIGEEALRFAALLRNLGLHAGDVAILKASNCPEFVVASLALAALGVAKAVVNSSAESREIAHVVHVTHPRAFISDGSIDLTAIEAPSVECAVGICGARIGGARFASWDSSAFEPLARESLPQISARSVSDMLFTSGSTGLPKCVPLSHDQLLRSAYANALNRGFECGRSLLFLVPLCHCYGYVEGFLASLFVGGRLVFVEGKFDARACCDMLEEESVNDVLSMPYTMSSLVRYLQSNPRRLPCLHAVYCSGEKAPASLYTAIQETLGVYDIVNGYGMTEICGAALQTIPGDDACVWSSRVGRVLPAGCAGDVRFGGALVEYRVVDDEGRELPIGECGNLEVRGVTRTQGYFSDDEANARNFGSGGWFKTGDVGRFDDRDYLELVDRVKDMYRINGENVSPSFVSDVIASMPGVHRAVVVGVPDARFGQVGCLFVEVDERPDFPKALLAYCRKNLARFQIPKYVVVLHDGEWPRTASGKIQRSALAQRFSSGAYDACAFVFSFSRNVPSAR